MHTVTVTLKSLRLARAFSIAFLFPIIMIRVPGAGATEIEFPYIMALDDSIVTGCAVLDSLPPGLLAYIDKGVPTALEYRIELWKVRRGWFDGRIDAFDMTYRIRYDIWEKKYTVIQIGPDLVIEYIMGDRREMTDLVGNCGRVSFPLDDTSATCYLIGRLSIKILTLSNLKEVESWLKGEISGAEKPDLNSASDKFGEFLFDTALKITGLQNISLKITSGNFRSGDLRLQNSQSTEP